MSFRPRHLACLILLLSSIGAAQAQASARDSGFRGSYISVLLYRNARPLRSDYAPSTLTQSPVGGPAAFALPIAARATFTAAWTMRAPAAHTAEIHALTGFSR